VENGRAGRQLVNCVDYIKFNPTIMHYTLYETEQHIFDKTLAGLFLVGKLIFKTLLYLPILFSGYWLATIILNQQDPAVLWWVTSLLFSYAVFCGVYCLKGILVACRDAGNLLWVPIFLICTGYTCMAPAWFVFHSIEPVMLRLTPDIGSTCTWLLSIGAAVYWYTQYNFLKDQAPLIAWPGYWLGNQLTAAFTRLSA
jgi:hypothetical protein